MSYCSQYFSDVLFCVEPEPVATITDLEGAALNIELAIQVASDSYDIHNMKAYMIMYLSDAITFLNHGRDYQSIVNNQTNVANLNMAIYKLNDALNMIGDANDVLQLQTISHGYLYAYMGIIGGLFATISSSQYDMTAPSNMY